MFTEDNHETWLTIFYNISKWIEIQKEKDNDFDVELLKRSLYVALILANHGISAPYHIQHESDRFIFMIRIDQTHQKHYCIMKTIVIIQFIENNIKIDEKIYKI